MHYGSWSSFSSEETFQMGRKLGTQLEASDVVCFFGELAAGKTTFIKGLVEGAAKIDSTLVQSPTFTYLNIYEGEKKIYHFDLYRLRDIDEFLGMGFDEFMGTDGICCIEWSERIEGYLPDRYIKVELNHIGEDQRLISITAKPN